MSFTVINPDETKFKAPIDETLMEKIRTNFDDHEGRIASGGSGGGGGLSFKVNGFLHDLKPYIGNNLQDSPAYQIDSGLVAGPQTFAGVKMFMRKSGTSGQTRIDIKRKVRVDHTIESIDYQMNFATQSIGRLGSALPTQAVSRRTPTISTQAINRAKSTESVEAVVNLGNGRARYNFSGGVLLDSDYEVGRLIEFSSMNNGSNNGDFRILEVNPDGYPGVVVDNGSAVTDITPGGNANLNLFEYVFTNPVDVDGFKVGEFATMNGHSVAGNNGSFEIVKINFGGNNLIVWNENTTGTTQGAPAGTVDSRRFVYTFSAPVDETNYFIGELALMSSHSSGNNNGNFEIVAINEAGNNLVVINPNGVVQAGAAGNAQTNRWIYSVLTPPTEKIAVGDLFGAFNHSNGGNNGIFEVKELERFALNNIIIYNPSGATQSGAAGTIRSEKMIISFGSDLSAFYTANRSLVTVKNTASVFTNKLYFEVVEINRGGGAAYNVVVKVPDALTEATSFAQLYAKGQIDMESRSLFSTLPKIDAGENPDFGGNDAVFVSEAVPEDSILSLDLVELADGETLDLSVQLS